MIMRLQAMRLQNTIDSFALSPWAGNTDSSTTLQSRLALMVRLPERFRAVAPSAPYGSEEPTVSPNKLLSNRYYINVCRDCKA